MAKERVLPNSGAIALSQIKAEFNKGNNLTSYVGAASGVPTSPPIKNTDFYGKSSGGGSYNPALQPTFSTPVSNSSGFTVQVTNYSSSWSWSTSSTGGSSSINGSGLVTVSGLAGSQSATVTVTTIRTGYYTGSRSVTGTASAPGIKPALTPTFGAVSSVAGGFNVQVTNYDPLYSWTASASPGSATISSTGACSVTGLGVGASSTLTVSTSRPGYNNGSNTVRGSAEGATDFPIDSTVTGGSFTTSGGKKIVTITSTSAEGCMKINSIAKGSYSNVVRALFVGAGGGGGGGGRSHQIESNGSITGGGGGAGGLVTYTKSASAGEQYCGKPGAGGAGGNSKAQGGNGNATSIRAPGSPINSALGGGGGGSHGAGTNYHGKSGGAGGGGGGRYGTSNTGSGGSGSQGQRGGNGNTGGGGGGGGHSGSGATATTGANDNYRRGGRGGNGYDVPDFGVYCGGGGGASAGNGAGGSGGSGGGGTGGQSVNGYGTATAGSKQGAGGGGGGASSNGGAAESGKAGAHGVVKFSHAI